MLDTVRKAVGSSQRVKIVSHNNFPTAAGLASSSSGLSSLSLALSELFQASSDSVDIGVLARLGSGSACRSRFGGFVVWDKGYD